MFIADVVCLISFVPSTERRVLREKKVGLFVSFFVPGERVKKKQYYLEIDQRDSNIK